MSSWRVLPAVDVMWWFARVVWRSSLVLVAAAAVLKGELPVVKRM